MLCDSGRVLEAIVNYIGLIPELSRLMSSARFQSPDAYSNSYPRYNHKY